MSAPEKIWAWTWSMDYPSKMHGQRCWGVDVHPLEQGGAEYTRSDLIPTAAYVAGLEAAASEFVRRCENGEVRSKKSYAAFKAALSARPDAHDVRVVNVAQLERWNTIIDKLAPGFVYGSGPYNETLPEMTRMCREIRAIIGETKK